MALDGCCWPEGCEQAVKNQQLAKSQGKAGDHSLQLCNLLLAGIKRDLR
jgi:hypothetical protein